jgi:2-polyprenyl-3-methyl-5-hydroxy-6-metoxy-1,4-benzoquinol methylase
MKAEEDAAGQLFWTLYKGGRGSEIIERDDGRIFRSSGDTVYLSNYEEWNLHEKVAIEFVNGRVLDIGCGAGRHSLYLQDKGFNVLGIDSSPLAIKVCKLRGLKKAETLSIEEVDFKTRVFDTILLMGGNFGLLGDFKKAQRLLKRFNKFTSKDALIIVETTDPYKTIRARAGGELRNS